MSGHWRLQSYSISPVISRTIIHRTSLDVVLDFTAFSVFVQLFDSFHSWDLYWGGHEYQIRTRKHRERFKRSTAHVFKSFAVSAEHEYIEVWVVYFQNAALGEGELARDHI